ncbi:MAG: hypothetical protein N2C14_08790, partial [Planctomycetales bacterium]
MKTFSASLRSTVILSALTAGAFSPSLVRGQALTYLEGHAKSVRGAVYSPDGRVLATSGSDGEVNVWDRTDGALIRVLCGHGPGAAALAISPDGQWLATGGTDRAIRVHETPSRRANAKWPGLPAEPTAFYVDPQGRFGVVACQNNVVRAWNPQTGATVRDLPGASAPVLDLAVSDNGALLFATTADRKLL